MFARFFAAIVLALSALVAASALPRGGARTTHKDVGHHNGFSATGNNVNQAQPITVNQCNTGTIQCCNYTQTVSYFASSPYLSDTISDYALPIGGLQQRG